MRNEPESLCRNLAPQILNIRFLALVHTLLNRLCLTRLTLNSLASKKPMALGCQIEFDCCCCFSFFFWGSRGGAVVRALASHQCGPGSIPGLGVICGLSLLLVLVLAPRVFLRVLRFSSLLKN